MGSHDGKRRQVPDFEIALLGYDRRQVERCLADMADRLEVALAKLDSLELLQAQLCEAYLEIDQLRLAAEERPSVANRISKLMMTAEDLYARARQEAEAVRAAAHEGTPAGADPPAAVASAE